MLLVAPDPRLGIAPERIARVRVLLDATPSAPGVAIALPGGSDGVLDALVLRPDGVLGLVPGPAAARRPVGVAGTTGGGPAGSGALGTLEDATPATGIDATGIDTGEAAREVDRLLALGEPAPGGPRRVVALPSATDTQPPLEARAALVATPGPPVLGVGDVRRLFVALRLVDHVPGADALADAGFPAHALPSAPPTAPVATAAPREFPPRETAPRESPHRESPHREPLAATGHLPSPGGPRRSRADARSVPAWVWTWRGLAVAAALVFLLAVGAAVVVVRTTSSPVAAAPVDAATPKVAGAITWTRQALTLDTTCVDHAYGLAAPFLRERPCVRLERSLWSGTGPQGPMLLAISQVTMTDPQSAGALKSLVDTSGTGNVSDLLREGRTFPGAPSGLTEGGYASAIDGSRVSIVESDWLDTSRADEPTLDQTARDALAAGVGAPTG